MNILRSAKRKRQKLFPTRRHLLIHGGQSGCGPRIVGHQTHNVDEILFPKNFHGARERVGTQFMPAEDLAAHLNDDRFFLAQAGKGLPVSDHIDD